MKTVETKIRVIYGDTDAMGQAYYANFYRWFEIGRTEWFRSQGFCYRELEQREGIYLPVLESHCQHLKPAYYDDVLKILTTASMAGKARVQFNLEIHREFDGELLAKGYTIHVFLSQNGKVLKPPAFFKTMFACITVGLFL